MTSSRYQLERDTEGGHGSRGLGIQVFDVHTGKSRGTDTMSGGETFIGNIENWDLIALGSCPRPDVLFHCLNFRSIVKPTDTALRPAQRNKFYSALAEELIVETAPEPP